MLGGRWSTALTRGQRGHGRFIMAYARKVDYRTDCPNQLRTRNTVNSADRDGGKPSFSIFHAEESISGALKCITIA